jgi:MFS family permease
MLSGAVATPIFGGISSYAFFFTFPTLTHEFHKGILKRRIIVALCLIPSSIGMILAGAAGNKSIFILIAARALQGLGIAITPTCLRPFFFFNQYTTRFF